MGYPLIDEFCRAHELRPEFFRRCQREFRSEVQPMLDQREQLLVENAALTAEVADLKEKLDRKRTKVSA
jgi:hypothetical protein